MNSRKILQHITTAMIFSIAALTGVQAKCRDCPEKAAPKKKAPICIKDTINKYLSACNDCDFESDELIYVYDASCKKWYRYEQGQVTDCNVNMLRERIWFNRPFRIAVIKVNRYLYKIDIQAEDYDYSSTPPSLFNSLFLSGASGATSVVDKLVDESIRSSTGSGEAAPRIEENTREKYMDLSRAFDTKLKEFKSFWYGLWDDMLEAHNACTLDAPCCGAISKISMDSVYKNYAVVEEAYNDIIRFIMERKSEKIQKEGYLNDVLAAFNDCNKAEQELPEAERGGCDSSQASVARQEIAGLQLIIDKEAGWEELWEKVVMPADTDIQRLVFFKNNIIKGNYLLLTPPVTPTGDRVKLSVDLQFNDSSHVHQFKAIPGDNYSLSYDKQVLGKCFLGFGSGPFIGMGGNFYQNEYAFRKVPDAGNIVADSAKYELVAAGRTPAPLGIAALAHLGYRFAPDLSIAGSIGAGATIESNPRIAYMGGVSLLLGDKHQFALTAGVTALQTRVLKASLYPQGTYYTATSDIEYKKEWAAGGFVSLTYVIFSSQKRNDD